ncbi:putative disease resistance protein RGA1 [Silene latifolia]|uniref:putative disease resistance protein RGA1 n=1 Tax=Silene latifolia TaxID=37657 RepID=UPI003D77F2DD
MDAPDLVKLVIALRQILQRNESMTLYLGDTGEVENLLVSVGNALYSSYKNKLEGDKKIDKDGERRVKQGLYQVETLFREIEKFDGEDQHPSLIVQSFRSLTAMKMRLIFEELEPYSDGLPWLFIKEMELVGLEYKNEKETLIKMLLDSNSSQVLPILGKPGSGKSTLAQFVLRDPRIRGHFHPIFCINLTYESCEYGNPSNIERDTVRNNIRNVADGADGRKCLIVLDDVSDLNILNSLLLGNADELYYDEFVEKTMIGSKIIIISSLELEVEVEHVVRLSCLNWDESWNLFRKIAFLDQQEQLPDLLPISRTICQKCGNIPAIINIVASIFSSKSTTEEWFQFHDVITSVPDPISIISSTIALTELHCNHQIQKVWRHCFAWCSLLPKDYEFQKHHIVHLWRAQDDFNKLIDMTPQRLDQCFDEFLRRGYFFEGKSDSYKINHLVLELMKHVAGDDFCLVDKPTTEPNHKIIRHASFIIGPSWEPPSWLFHAKQLQSLLLWPRNSGEFVSLSKIDLILSRMTNLRALHAEAVQCERLPTYLPKFTSLVYLKFGEVSSISLPGDIPALQKLLNCDVRYKKPGPLVQSWLITIKFKGEREKEEEERLAFLVTSAGFTKMTIHYEECNNSSLLEQTNKIIEFFNLQSSSIDGDDGALTIARDPIKSLESLEVHQWKGDMLPVCTINERSIFLNSLLSIQIVNCSGCQHLPGFNTLPRLSSLQIGGLCSLVNITITDGISTKTFYPSLKRLVLCDLPELKGWLYTEEEEKQVNQPILQLHSFPLLTNVRLQGCPKLMSMPPVPMLESLEAINIDSKIVNLLHYSPRITIPPTDISDELPETSKKHLSLVRNLEIDSCKVFEWGDMTGAFSCLRSLKLTNAPELESLPRELESVTILERLALCWLTNLKVLPEWIGQFTELRQLTIHYCLKLKMIPNSSTLEELEIQYCPKLTQFPKCFPNLKRLRVQEFSRFQEILGISQNLSELEINNCEEFDWETANAEDDNSLRVWASLKKLESLKLTKLKTPPKGLDLDNLHQFRRLVIQKCPGLPTVDR